MELKNAKRRLFVSGEAITRKFLQLPMLVKLREPKSLLSFFQKCLTNFPVSRYWEYSDVQLNNCQDFYFACQIEKKFSKIVLTIHLVVKSLNFKNKSSAFNFYKLTWFYFIKNFFLLKWLIATKSFKFWKISQCEKQRTEKNPLKL